MLYKLTVYSKNCLISSFGNAPEDITAKNAKEFIAYVANNWSYLSGSKSPLNGKFEHPWPYYFHGRDGVWGVHPEVDVDDVKLLSVWPHNKNVVSLAPMSGLVELTDIYRPCEITIMGGVFFEEGNETKYAETNIAFDPEAAQKFFNHCNGIKAKVVPLDVTRQVFWTLDMVRKVVLVWKLMVKNVDRLLLIIIILNVK
ncbi:nucleoside hydrolase [Candidatus Gottesmanbacteria bacterium]|nr:nucleoside hydrolase [Candidatus Gottesmanbacteria bacterium]